jgi:uncharacterized protein YndB with AHSA1/START domain
MNTNHSEKEEVVVERMLRAPSKLVWDAITSKTQMKEWFFDLNDFKAEEGFRFSFSGKGHKGDEYLHLCEVLEVIPGEKLRFSWTYENIEGYSEVSFLLRAEGNETHFMLVHRGINSFPRNSSDFAAESFTQGWAWIIGKALVEFTERRAQTQ